MHSETTQFMITRLEECLQASHNIVIQEADRLIYVVMIKRLQVGTDYILVVPNFLVVRTVNDYYIVREKKDYVIDEYTRFGPISYEEIVREIEDTEIELEFKHIYSKVKMY